MKNKKNYVVYNAAYGGYCLSKEAIEWLYKNGRDEIKAIASKIIEDGFTKHINGVWSCWTEEIARHDADLVRCVRELGEAAEGGFARLRIREITGNKYRINEYDGWEGVVTPEEEEWIEIQ